MLLLTRIAGSDDGRDEIIIKVPGFEEEIVVRFYRSSNRNQVRVGIKAPLEMVIMRGELLADAEMAPDEDAS